MEISLSDAINSDGTTQFAVWLEQRTRGLVRDAGVEIIDGRLIVHGTTGSQHVREVATLALAVLLGEVRTSRIEIRLERAEVTQPAEAPRHSQGGTSCTRL